MSLSALFPFVIIAFLASVAFLVYRIPLDLKIVFERTGAGTILLLSATWSVLTVESTTAGGDGTLSFFLQGKRIFRREFSRKPGSVKNREPVSQRKDLLLQTLPMVPDIWRFMTAILRHLTIRQIEGNFTIGLRNPADTGVIFGFFSSIRPLLLTSDRISLSMEPVFDREIFEGRFMAGLRISRPLFIPVLMLRMAGKSHTRGLIRGIASQTPGSAG